MGEDTELSHAIMYTGSKLYFDERLWFKHDLSGNRLSKKNRRAQLKSNDSAIFVVFHMAYHGNNNNYFYPRYISMLFSLSVNLFFQFFKKNNYIAFVQLRIQYFEFALHPLKYKRLFEKSYKWISKIKDTYPLKNEEEN
ncbi:MAG: hypothetical protein C0596_08580 [Marinilabiliales bacterium]|nr:MAG: hypothetical protein C0596_08580 [Marinilabiliales bacterium]